MKYRDWEIGTKIVCVDASLDRKYLSARISNYNDNMDGLEKYQIYTIRDIAPYHWDESILTVFLHEIRRSLHSGQEPGYNVKRFRKLPDISIFEKMLVERVVKVSDYV